MIRLRMPASLLAEVMEPAAISAIATAMAARSRPCPICGVECDQSVAGDGACRHLCGVDLDVIGSAL